MCPEFSGIAHSNEIDVLIVRIFNVISKIEATPSKLDYCVKLEKSVWECDIDG